MARFCHLHNHTEYSLLDGASHIERLMQKAKNDGQHGLAMTDHGNMFGAFRFVSLARKYGLKPIIGCEFYLVEDRHKKSFLSSRGERDKRYHQLLLAKNAKGYQNLSKLCSLGFIEGLYGKFPRIDKELITQYNEGIIATSCCISAEIPSAIIRGNIEEAETLLKWWLDIFQDDYYIEIMRHNGLENINQSGVSQADVNNQLLKFANKYNIKVIATNDAHYVEKDDWYIHDILLCINTGKKIEEKERFKFSSTDYYFKTQDEMTNLFADIPHSLENTLEVFDKIDTLNLERDILLPNFPLPDGFDSQSDYLKNLVYKGAKKRYKHISKEIEDRINHELHIIASMGFDGYFLIVQDFIAAAKELKVSVGPGRGSAAGSIVAYCLSITNVDPLKYNLLFERFLNPERISMPDIDIDFDDDGRQKVIDWVVNKYGNNQVAQIVTFGRMKTRSSIRDVGRVLSLDFDKTGELANLVPSRPGSKFSDIFDKNNEELKGIWKGDDYSKVKKLVEISKKKSKESEIIALARQIEGTVRNLGVHAAGVIIAPDNLTNLLPVCTNKDSNWLITQFDGDIVENAGMLKMDFLGLTTLSIIRDCLENIKKSHGEKSVPEMDEIPLDDIQTMELFQKGAMTGIFQFESVGMRKYLRDLHPNDIEDIIAMNALYRPGPMEFIPSFIKRKHKLEITDYPHPWLEELLSPTYGIMVYQEQIMQTAQIMADYSLGKADMLRRAMGKKKTKEMEEHRSLFIEGASKKGVDAEKSNEIFDVMSKFAQYGFNRSHATAYSILAFQTAYLKAHYPAEFMAAVLTHGKNNIDKLNFLLRETRSMNIKVLGPDINESDLNFTVTPKNNLRFGLSALKGIGEGPGNEIIQERQLNGPFFNIYDLCKRLSSKSVNKKNIESLVYGGAFDSFSNIHRSQYFAPSDNYETAIEHAIAYGTSYKKQLASLKTSLFGDMTDQLMNEPKLPDSPPWNNKFELTKEKEMTGIYISGHPLDDYILEVDNFITHSINDSKGTKLTRLKLAGMVTKAFHGINKKGNGYARFTVQDYDGSEDFALFGHSYNQFHTLIHEGEVLYIEGEYALRYNSDKYHFAIKDIQQLETYGKNNTKSITLFVAIEKIMQDELDNLERLLEENKGKHPIKIKVIDQTKNISLTFLPKTKKVNISNQLIKNLKHMKINYKLN